MIKRLVHRLRHPQTTVRWRLTLMYGGLFLVCGAALLAVTYVLVARGTVTETRLGPVAAQALVRLLPAGPFRGPASFTDRQLQLSEQLKAIQATFNFTGGGRGDATLSQVQPGHASPGGGNVHVRVPPAGAKEATPPPSIRKFLGSRQARDALIGVVSQQRVADLHQLELWSGIALGIMAILAAALGWVVAGRVLRPLKTITATTRAISEANLYQRLALPGPRDELRTLADTIDGLLERLQSAFDAQRRFVSNASHELRTPLTAAQALLEMVMSDPNADADTFRVVCAQVLEESAQQEELIDALLALARGQRGIDRREPVALAEVTADVVRRRELDLQANGLTLDVSLERATAAGDRRLLERLVANLFDNAIRHNVHGGSVSLRVATAADGRATLSIANTGATVPLDEVERLLQPFQRMAADRVGPRDGLGLGLSIVAAIASAHDATLDVRPRDGGGLEIALRFPPAPAHAPAREPAEPPAAVPA